MGLDSELTSSNWKRLHSIGAANTNLHKEYLESGAQFKMSFVQYKKQKTRANKRLKGKRT